jgi:hypothetical protein
MTTKLAKTAQFNRSGNVHYRLEERPEGGVVSMSVDFERAPVPDRSYVADYYEVHKVEDNFLMVFGKKEFPSESDLRNKIEIYFPFIPFVQQLWRSSRKMHTALQEAFASKDKTAKPQGHIATKAITMTLSANNLLVVNSGGQCVMDFFLISAKDLWLKTRKGDPLNLDAIVRVFVSEPLLLGFLDRCDVLAQEIRGNLDIPVMEEENEVLESIG